VVHKISPRKLFFIDELYSERYKDGFNLNCVLHWFNAFKFVTCDGEDDGKNFLKFCKFLSRHTNKKSFQTLNEKARKKMKEEMFVYILNQVPGLPHSITYQDDDYICGDHRVELSDILNDELSNVTMATILRCKGENGIKIYKNSFPIEKFRDDTQKFVNEYKYSDSIESILKYTEEQARILRTYYNEELFQKSINSTRYRDEINDLTNKMIEYLMEQVFKKSSVEEYPKAKKIIIKPPSLLFRQTEVKWSESSVSKRQEEDEEEPPKKKRKLNINIIDDDD